MGIDEKLDEQIESTTAQSHSTKLTCGIVMPIASMGDYTEAHWLDVYDIIKEAVALSGYEARLVSESKDSTVIPKSIVQNLYDDDIVVCDVSGKNPNVMFELGMRLAFDKPVVLIKDSETGYSFDTSSIEHLSYPRDLRYSEIQKFKQRLGEKIAATYKASMEDGYRSFLSNFATIKVAHLEQTTLSEGQVLERILYKLDAVEGRLNEQAQENNIRNGIGLPNVQYLVTQVDVEYANPDTLIQELENRVHELYGKLIKIRKVERPNNKITLRITSTERLSKTKEKEVLANLEPFLSDLTLPF